MDESFTNTGIPTNGEWKLKSLLNNWFEPWLQPWTQSVEMDPIEFKKPEQPQLDGLLILTSSAKASTTEDNESPKKRKFSPVKLKKGLRYANSTLDTIQSCKRAKNIYSPIYSTPPPKPTTTDKENLRPSILDYEEQEESPVPPPPAPPPLPAIQPFQAKKRKQMKRLKTLPWIPLPDHKIGSTFWGEHADQLSHLVDNDFEELFAAAPGKTTPVNSPKKQQVKSLLTLQRANNIVILLNTCKLSKGELKNAMMNFDESVLSVEMLMRLRSMVPTDDEKKLLEAFKEEYTNLGKAEQFLMDIMHIPRLNARLDFFLLHLQLPAIIHEIQSNSDAILLACKEVRSSDKFARILKLVHTLGSIMNNGTYLNSSGFKLESLLKLADTKSKNENTTLLHYVVNLVQKKIPEVVNFCEDLPHVAVAAQVSVDHMFTELKALSHALSKLQSELNAMSRDEDPLFHSTMSAFHEVLKKNVEECNEKMQEMANAYREISNYFGEDNTSEKFAKQFFANLSAFLQAFERAMKENEESTMPTRRRRHSFSTIR